MNRAGSRPSWPEAGVVRIHFSPAALPQLGDEPGTNRFDDPRPRTVDRFLMRYTASSLRGCLLELLAGLRQSPKALEREAAVDIEEDPDLVPPPVLDPWQHIAEFLNGRRVARMRMRDPHVVSINDPETQAQLDTEPAVRSVLDTAGARAALLPGSSGRVRLDNAAVRLSSELGRIITQGCALALYDRDSPPDVIHYRSRHDDAEDCWALYHHVEVEIDDPVLLSPSIPEHHAAFRAVADLWGLPVPPTWL